MSLTNLKKGDKVILHMFTGIAVNCTPIIAMDGKTITIEKKDGTKVKFSKKTGKQVEPPCKSDRFANYITEDDGSYQPAEKAPSKKKVKKADDKKPSKKVKAKPEPEEDEDEDEVEEAPKPAKKTKKTTSKAPAKKSKKKPEPEEDEDFDEDEYEEEE